MKFPYDQISATLLKNYQLLVILRDGITAGSGFRLPIKIHFRCSFGSPRLTFLLDLAKTVFLLPSCSLSPASPALWSAGAGFQNPRERSLMGTTIDANYRPSYR
jgi:hypothetical protein